MGGLIPTVVDEDGRACGGAAPPTVGPEFPIAGLVALGAVLLFMLAFVLAELEVFVLLDEEQPAQNAAIVMRAKKAKVRRMCFS